MPELQIYNLDDIDTLVANLTEGEYVFGRGSLLKCEDRLVSRNHGVLKVQQDSITITSIHQNPCFFQSSDSATITILPKHNPIHVRDGDKFALLADKFWFKVRVVNAILAEDRDSLSIMEEASSSKRKAEDKDSSSSKRAKNDQNFSFSESSNDSVDFLKLDQSCVKNSDVLPSIKVLSNSGNGDNSNDSIDFLQLGDTNNTGEQPIEGKENNSGYINNVESCSINKSVNIKNEDGEIQPRNEVLLNNESEESGTNGMQLRKSTDFLKTEADQLQSLEDVLSDLANSNKTSKILKSGESTQATVLANMFETEVKNENQIQPKKEVLSESEDDKNLTDVLIMNTASGSGGIVAKREVLSDSENENEPSNTKRKKKITKKKEQTNEAYNAKLKAMLDSSDEDEVGLEVGVNEISAIPTAEVDDHQQTDDLNKKQSNDTNCATTSGTNDRIFRERCWYGSSCFRKNAGHLRELSHPGDSDYETDPGDARPMCVYGGSCYRRNPDHRKEYRHPKAKNDNNAIKKNTPANKRRAPAKKYNESSEDDYDLQDPFIGDSGSEFDVDSVSEDTTDTDFSDGAEEETKRLVKESKRFLKKNKKGG